MPNTPSPEYEAWKNMKQRCLNPRHPLFANYGGRGINICFCWIGSYVSFLRDMGPKPTTDHAIARRDINGPYDPDNCYWATKKELNSNTRHTHRLTLHGQTKSITDWALDKGMNPGTLNARIRKGWSTEAALLSPIDSDRCPKAHRS